MTWIVGTPTMFGYGFALSDVRVTLGNNTEVDCLQKIYPVGRSIAAGFAGSVAIGFGMVDELRQYLYLEEEDMAWQPLFVAEEWPARARKIFLKFPPESRDGGCHLMLISADPQEHTGNPAWPRSYVHIFKSPGFEPERVLEHKIGSIGCGNEYESCRQAVERSVDDFMQGEVGTSGGTGSTLGGSLTRVLKQAQPGGVSSHLQYCWVYRDRIIIQTNNHLETGPWSIWKHGSGLVRDQSATELRALDVSTLKTTTLQDATEFEMPRLATTWEELNELLLATGARAEGSVAQMLRL
jgi:hypothetical protein